MARRRVPGVGAIVGGVAGTARRAIEAAVEDVESAMARDPALTSMADAVLNSPGLHAIWSHRVSSAMWQQGGALRMPARLLATTTRAVTGIEIHPGAQVGRRCFIDHGMGVVIGETTVIGDDVLLYHGATLGARDAAAGQRHPTIGNRVMVGAGARILGPVVVGDDARVGANAVVVHDVPEGATAVGVAARVAPAAPGADRRGARAPSASLPVADPHRSSGCVHSGRFHAPPGR